MAIMSYTLYQRLYAFHVHRFVINYIKINLYDHVHFFAGKYDDRHLQKVERM